MSELVPSKPGGLGDSGEALPPEDTLDALLDQVEQKKAKRDQDEPDKELDSVDQFRNNMRRTYMPAYEDLKEKYAEKGILLDMDVDEFLGGGSTLKFMFSYESYSLELEGTVMRNGVAFYVTRSIGEGKSAVTSGPLMRIRNLTADDFRKFIVEQLSTLIKDALRQI